MQPIYVLRGDENSPSRVDRYPELPKPFLTVSVHTQAFIGAVQIYGSIELEPGDSDWFLLGEIEFETRAFEALGPRNHIENFPGRIMWVKATVVPHDPPQGRVDRVTVI